jgi:hypothetical protein
MTNFLMFLQWQWRRFDWGERTLILALIIVIASIAVPAPYNDYVWSLGIGINLAVAFKWFIWDRAVESYARYKKQRDGLFNEIRGE